MSTAGQLAYLRAHLGMAEAPPHSNRVPVWDEYAAIYGAAAVAGQGDAWCGALVACALHAGGWKPPADFVSVWAIEDWGRARGRYTPGAAGVAAGDVLILDGHGQHTGTATGPMTSGLVPTIEGNEGDAVRALLRPAELVIGRVRVRDLLGDIGPIRLHPVSEDVDMQLAAGSTGKSVALYQRCLTAWGAPWGMRLCPSGADGVYGPETVAAVKAYQLAADLPQTGTIDGLVAAQLVRYEPRRPA